MAVARSLDAGASQAGAVDGHTTAIGSGKKELRSKPTDGAGQLAEAECLVPCVPDRRLLVPLVGM